MLFFALLKNKGMRDKKKKRNVYWLGFSLVSVCLCLLH